MGCSCGSSGDEPCSAGNVRSRTLPSASRAQSSQDVMETSGAAGSGAFGLSPVQALKGKEIGKVCANVQHPRPRGWLPGIAGLLSFTLPTIFKDASVTLRED